MTELYCDVCEKRMESILEEQEMVRINFTGGYGSIFGDGNSIRLDICQHCLQEKLGESIRVD